MSSVQQQTAPGARKVSLLRKALKSPKAWLAAILAVSLLGAIDSFRDPADQITARLYIGGIHAYQKAGRPLLRGIVVCRYKPTCSEYSKEAVRKHGIREGLSLTARRVSACSPDAPPDTYDPVP